MPLSRSIVAAPAHCVTAARLTPYQRAFEEIAADPSEQLTSDKSRTEAHRFYERLGFSATHEGFKLKFA